MGNYQNYSFTHLLINKVILLQHHNGPIYLLSAKSTVSCSGLPSTLETKVVAESPFRNIRPMYVGEESRVKYKYLCYIHTT